ncbi:unnamed protein product [Lathyrus sativus]|nr:unnamed protein product [Lathyrus sativus]
MLYTLAATNEELEVNLNGVELARQREEVTKKVWRSFHNSESILRQKSRSLWIKEGDRNTKFFHNAMKSRLRRNNIAGLNTDRGRIEEVYDVKEEFKNHFKRRFSEINHNRLTLDGVSFNQLSVEDNTILEQPFSLEEIKTVVWNGDKDKSPGPGGFSMGFFKVCWEFLKDHLFRFAKEFHECGRVPKAITTSFLVLVLKDENP